MFYNAKRIIVAVLAVILTVGGKLDVANVLCKPQSVMADYYVSVSGNDNADGSKEAPFATIARAQAEVRKHTDNMTGDIVVHIADGNYVLADTLTFDERDSASGGFAVRFVGSGNAVISGGREIKNFTLHDAQNHIWRADVPDGMTFRQVYIDGKKITRARSNSDYSTRIAGASRFDETGTQIPENLNNWNEQTLVPASYGEIYLKENEFRPFSNLEQTELHVLTAWVKNVLRVKSAHTENGITAIRVQDHENDLIFNRPHPDIDGYSHMNTHEFVYYLENAYELMDTDYEWYLDENTGTLYVKMPADADINAATVTVPALECLVRVGAANGGKVCNLAFENLTFRYSNWTLPSEQGLVDIQAGMYATFCVFKTNELGVARPASAVYAADTKNFTVKNCVIENAGAAAIDLHHGTEHSLIQDNLIQNISGNGIMVGRFAVDENTDIHIVYNPQDKSDICTGDRIVNNRVLHTGTDYESAVAICAGYPKNILIANNEVAYAPYTGISVGFGWSDAENAMEGNRILNNEIHHTSQVLCDAGGIYTLSRQPDSQMSGNYIHDITLPAWADYDTSGIYMDEQTSGYTVQYNVLERARGVGMNRTGENNYKSSTIYVDAKWNPQKQAIIQNAGVNKNYDLYAKLFY